MGRQTKANKRPLRCPQCNASQGTRRVLHQVRFAGLDHTVCGHCKTSILEAAVVVIEPHKAQTILDFVPHHRAHRVSQWIRRFKSWFLAAGGAL